MSVTINKMTVAFAMVALAALASGVSAAPSLGIPKGKQYYGAHSGSHVVGAMAPARSAETRQSFSYEPAEGVAKTHGCPQQGKVAPAAPQEDVATAPPTTRRSFSYEPSDAAPARSFRSAAPNRDRWLIPKTDPRRYSH